MEIKNISPYHVKKNDLNVKKNQLLAMPLTESIREFGFISPIITDCEGNVIDGNERLEIARLIRLDTVPVIQTDLTPEQGEKYAIVANHIQQLAGWDHYKKKTLVEKMGINKNIYHMADEIRSMDDIKGMFTEEDTVPLFPLFGEGGGDDEDNLSGI